MSVLALLSASGFSRSSSSAAHLLSEVTQRYIQLLGSTCVQHANHAGRTTISPRDLCVSLAHIMGGDPVEELLDWAEQEGRLQFNNPIAGLNALPGSTLETGSSSDPLRDPMRGKDLVRILHAGRVMPEAEAIHFSQLDSGSYQQMAAESLLREYSANQYIWSFEKTLTDDARFADSDSEADRSESDAASSSSGSPSHTHSSKKRRGETGLSSKRLYGSTIIDYVPAYLPLLPSYSTDVKRLPIEPEADESVSASISMDVDPEFVEDERQRKEAAQRQAEEQAAALAAAKVEVDGEMSETPAAPVLWTAEEKAAEAEKAFEALQARRVLRNNWREAVVFSTSSLAVSYPKEELRDVEANTQAAVLDVAGSSLAPSTSSLRAFTADFQALAEDPSSSSSAGIYLTPFGAAYQDAATKRRRLAHAIADASRYTPNDSLYASVAARPSILPFQPGPSWLVSTLPPPTLYEDNIEVANALSAPMLTPFRPQGRPAALIPASGSLVPTLAHRHPAHLSIGARVVSSSELLKKMSRYDDPAPLLDDKHAERFFHGVPASRDLLGGSGSSSDLSSNISSTRNSAGGGSGSGNSTLRPALEKLVLQMKEKEAEILPEEDKEELQRRQQELQLQLQAAMASENSGGGAMGKDSAALSSGLIADSYASRIRNGNITLVHTWDWAPRDPYDSSLPGKRNRAADGKPVTPLAFEKKARRDTLPTNFDAAPSAVNVPDQK